MLEDFRFNVEYGISHVLDINGYDHVLFLIVLAVPYVFKQWKKALLMVTLFTIGHTLSLVLAAYDYAQINGELVEFLIPVTILIAALYNVVVNSKIKNSKHWVLFFSTLFFGIIHGLGFAREYKMLAGTSDNKLALLIEFALGIEIAQVIIVVVALILGFVFQTFFRVARRDWIIVISAIVIGLVLPMIANSDLLA